MSADGFVSLLRPDAGFNLIFLRTSLPTFKPEHMKGHRVVLPCRSPIILGVVH